MRAATLGMSPELGTTQRRLHDDAFWETLIPHRDKAKNHARIRMRMSFDLRGTILPFAGVISTTW